MATAYARTSEILIDYINQSILDGLRNNRNLVELYEYHWWQPKPWEPIKYTDLTGWMVLNYSALAAFIALIGVTGYILIH